jgi:rhodanese-related sulfurtransferase
MGVSMGFSYSPFPFSISPTTAFTALLGPNPPVLLDSRRDTIIAESGRMIPQARFADHGDGDTLAATLDRARPVIIACAHGHNRSQRLAAHLRAEGFNAATMADGYDGWRAAGLPTVAINAGPVALGAKPTVWVTRRHPKIDRVACPWLIRRFLDPDARFLFADTAWVLEVAESEGGIAYDLPGGAFEHDGPLCSFDTILRAFGLDSFAPLAKLALIVRGADTDRLDLAPQAAGLLAVSLDLSARHCDNDHAVLADGFRVYDGLLAWAMHASDEPHNWVRPKSVEHVS